MAKLMSRSGHCIVEGCSDPIKAKGMCDKHHQRWRRHKDVNHRAVVDHKALGLETCIVIGCDKPVQSKGYCVHHARYNRENGSPYLPKVVKLCGVDGCYEDHWGKGLCKDHFYEWRKTLRKYKLPY